MTRSLFRSAMILTWCVASLLAFACGEDAVVASVTCGNGECEPNEDRQNCPADCPVVCGDEVCETGEDWGSCAADCPGSCGDGFCQPGEGSFNCEADCAPDCGNGSCDSGETASSCPFDCVGPPFAGPCTGDSTTLNPGPPTQPNPDELYSYDRVDGNLVIDVLRYYEPPFGDSEALHRYLFDPVGRLIGNDVDEGNDGVFDSSSRYFYDEQGRLVQQEVRTAPGGSLVSRTTHTRDASGSLEVSYQESFESGGHDVETTYEWAADHFMYYEHVDTDADGSIDFTNEVLHDEEGNVIHRISGELGTECEFHYDIENLYDVAPGAMIHMPWAEMKLRRVRLTEWHCSLEGSWDLWRLFAFDADGNLEDVEEHEYGVGAPSSDSTHLTEFNYDCWM